MKNDVIQKSFQSGIDHFSSMVIDAMGQLFNQTFSASTDSTVVRDVNRRVKKANYPCVGILFHSQGKNNCRHLVELPNELATKLYAWMVGAEAEAEVNAEIVKGLQEATNQILGQLQAGVDGQEHQFKISKITAQVIEAGKGFETGNEGRGVESSHKLSIAEKEYEVKHFIWMSETEELADSNTENDVIDVHPAEFSDLPSTSNGNGEIQSIDMLLDVDLEILVQLGRKTMTIRDVLKLGKGSVIELEKAAGEHLDIFVNRRKLAEGEVVVIDDHFGIRISQLLSPQERIKSLG